MMLSRPDAYLRCFRDLKNQYSQRVIEFEGGPGFVLSDILSNLSLGSTTKAMQFLGDDPVFDVLISGRGRPNKVIRTRSVLHLIQMARPSPSRKFSRWMETHVLPSVVSDGLNVTEWVGSSELVEITIDRTPYASVDGFFYQQRILINHHHRKDLTRVATEMCALAHKEIRVGQWFAPHLKSMVDVAEYPIAVLELAYNFLTKTGVIPAYDYSEATL